MATLLTILFWLFAYLVAGFVLATLVAVARVNVGDKTPLVGDGKNLEVLMVGDGKDFCTVTCFWPVAMVFVVSQAVIAGLNRYVAWICPQRENADEHDVSEERIKWLVWAFDSAAKPFGYRCHDEWQLERKCPDGSWELCTSGMPSMRAVLMTAFPHASSSLGGLFRVRHQFVLEWHGDPIP